MLRQCIKISAVLFAILSVGGMVAMAELSEPIMPIWSIVAMVDEDARGAFLDQAAKLAKKDAFAIRTSKTQPDGKHFLVQMWRQDVKITMVNPFNDPAEFRVNVYPTGIQPVSSGIVDSLARDLRQSLGAVPGVVLQEKK